MFKLHFAETQGPVYENKRIFRQSVRPVSHINKKISGFLKFLFFLFRYNIMNGRKNAGKFHCRSLSRQHQEGG